MPWCCRMWKNRPCLVVRPLLHIGQRSSSPCKQQTTASDTHNKSSPLNNNVPLFKCLENYSHALAHTLPNILPVVNASTACSNVVAISCYLLRLCRLNSCFHNRRHCILSCAAAGGCICGTFLHIDHTGRTAYWCESSCALWIGWYWQNLCHTAHSCTCVRHDAGPCAPCSPCVRWASCRILDTRVHSVSTNNFHQASLLALMSHLLVLILSFIICPLPTQILFFLNHNFVPVCPWHNVWCSCMCL